MTLWKQYHDDCIEYTGKRSNTDDMTWTSLDKFREQCLDRISLDKRMSSIIKFNLMEKSTMQSYQAWNASIIQRVKLKIMRIMWKWLQHISLIFNLLIWWEILNRFDFDLIKESLKSSFQAYSTSQKNFNEYLANFSFFTHENDQRKILFIFSFK